MALPAVAALLLSLGFSPPAAAIDAEVDIRFVGSRQSRTLVEGVVGVPVSAVQRNEHGYFNLRLSGEVLVAGRPYERFGYRYDIPAGQGGEAPLALSFQRAWRPGDLTLLLEVEDLQSGLVIRREQHVLVPRLRRPQAPAATVEPEATPRAAAIRLLPPPPVASRRQRFVAVIEGEGVEEVVFLLDGRRILSRRAPPFSAELDLGDSPRVHRLRVEARGAAGV
ncbi:MAG TPA: hypothetical protein VMT16_12185, partial [Thermoanaerobaculia bacterium]|nr:hypothetical protein [Thermoanaerobaculia bacterium]